MLLARECGDPQVEVSLTVREQAEACSRFLLK